MPQRDLNPGPPGRQSNALTHSATVPPLDVGDVANPYREELDRRLEENAHGLGKYVVYIILWGSVQGCRWAWTQEGGVTAERLLRGDVPSTCVTQEGGVTAERLLRGDVPSTCVTQAGGVTAERLLRGDVPSTCVTTAQCMTTQ